MTVGHWLETRDPAPPAELANRIRSVLGPAVEQDAAAIPELFVGLATSLLAALVRKERPGRENALDLLAVDALVTYAFEAVAGTPEQLPPFADRAMQRIAVVGSADA